MADHFLPSDQPEYPEDLEPEVPVPDVALESLYQAGDGGLAGGDEGLRRGGGQLPVPESVHHHGPERRVRHGRGGFYGCRPDLGTRVVQELDGLAIEARDGRIPEHMGREHAAHRRVGVELFEELGPGVDNTLDGAGPEEAHQRAPLLVGGTLAECLHDGRVDLIPHAAEDTNGLSAERVRYAGVPGDLPHRVQRPDDPVVLDPPQDLRLHVLRLVVHQVGEHLLETRVLGLLQEMDGVEHVLRMGAGELLLDQGEHVVIDDL